MTALIQRELSELFIMFYCGLAIMELFTGRDRLMKRCGTRRRLAVVIYFGTWLCAAFLFSQFLYHASHGVVTLYGLLSMGAGILLWKKYICGIMFSHADWRAESEDRGDV